MKKFISNTTILVGCALATTLLLVSMTDSGSRGTLDKMRGVCWVAGDSICAQNLEDLTANHIGWISQTPFAYQPKHNEPHMRFGESNWVWGEREAGIVHTTKLATAVGVQSLLKPHIWLHTSHGKWRADIKMESEEDWEAWFCNYQDFMIHYAKIAEAAGVSVLCIGTELYHPSTMFPDRWRGMIRDIRAEYTGKLTYAANFHMEYEEITWWDELDYIGVQAYFPLVNALNTSDADLVKGWKEPMQKLKSISERYGKQVIFTELGYRNDALAASEPWLWPSQIDRDVYTPDDDMQVKCYEAFFESCWKEQWLAGVFIWKWFHGSYRNPVYEDYLRIRREYRDSLYEIGQSRRRSDESIVFSPQGRPAQTVLKEYFGKD